MMLAFYVQEEEDLVNAHRRQVEETMDIVREVCVHFCGSSHSIIIPPPHIIDGVWNFNFLKGTSNNCINTRTKEALISCIALVFSLA